MFEAVSIRKEFKDLRQNVVVLDDVSFRLQKNSVVGFVGANGSGKTTTIKIIANLIRPDSGKIIWDDDKVKMGFFPERPYFYPHLTARQFISYMGHLSHMSKEEIELSMQKLADKFNLLPFLNNKLHSFSKGMLTRVGLIVSIMHKPNLLILDEPLSGLDPLGRKEIKSYLKEIAKQDNLIIFVGHILNDIEELCDQLLVIKDKKIKHFPHFDRLYQQSVSQYNVQFWGDAYLDAQKIDHNLYSLNCFSENKDELVSQILQRGGRLHSLSVIKNKLEDIIYK